MPAKLFTFPHNPRASKILVAAKLSEFELEIVSQPPDFELGVTTQTAEFVERFPLAKVPALITADGQPLYESNAIAQYVACQGNRCLLSDDSYDLALIQQFVSLADQEVYPAMCAWVYPILGIMPSNTQAAERAKGDMEKILGVLEGTLVARAFLIGRRLSLADVSVVCVLWYAMSHVLDPSYQQRFPHTTAWFLKCCAMPQFKEVLGDTTLCQEPPKEPASSSQA